MADTLCTKCRNPECEYAGRKVWVMICAHEYVAPPMTHGDQLRAMSDKELANYLNNVESDGRVYGPKGKAHWLDWLKQEAD